MTYRDLVFGGILLDETFLQSHFFALISAFVAINTVMYAALTLAKILPKIYITDLFTGRNRRRESRSIYPPQESEREQTQSDELA